MRLSVRSHSVGRSTESRGIAAACARRLLEGCLPIQSLLALHAGAVFICSPLAFASSAVADQDLVNRDFVAREFAFRWNRPVGLPDFENPEANVRAIEAAADAYSKAMGGTDPAGLLAPMPITRIPDGVGFRGAVQRRSPEKAYADCGPDDFVAPAWVSPRELRTAAKGVYRSASNFLLDRAGRWLEANPSADATLKEAVQAFRDEMQSVGLNTFSLEQAEFAVLAENLPQTTGDAGAVRFSAAGGGGAGQSPSELVSLTLLGGARVDASSFPELARQFEARLEALPFGAAAEGSGPLSLDFEVAVLTSDPKGGVVEIVASFVGPKNKVAMPVKRFALKYRGGDGAELPLRVQATEGAGPSADETQGFDLPIPADVLRATTVRLYRVRDGEGSYLTDFAPRATQEDVVDLRLDTEFEQPERLSVGSLQAVFEAITLTLQKGEDEEGGVAGGDLIGFFADAENGQIDLSRGGLDVRADGSADFVIKVVPGIVKQARTISLGERSNADDRVNSQEPRFVRLLENAPFQPASETPQVLREAPLREYLDRQSRHPNRRVDAAITAAESVPAVPEGATSDAPQWTSQGTVGIDFLVTENKPWSIFVQGSNTGVESTGEWQTRVGYFNSDAFGNDEIFSIEYVTTNFTDSNAVNAYFDAPLGESETLRWKLFAGYSQYNAADVGFEFADFEGESPLVGGEVAWNVAQWGKTFLDVVGGVSWTNVNVFNGLTGDTGDEDFLVPYVGARLQRNNRDATTDFAVYLDFGLGGDASQADLNKLGRLLPSEDWQMLRWDLAQSFYLDPLFQDPRDTANATLAHELYFRFRGQNSLGNRLVPQFMGTAGGFYTVRGYPTSLVAGDNLYLMTAEYRLHLPQLLGIDPNPQPFMGIGNEPFRLRPQFGYGPTDWDFIVRGFVDAGFVEIVDPFSFEDNADLVGAGFGVELQTYKGLAYPTLRNLSLRLDVGFPLIDPDFTEVDDVQFTFVGTLSF
jgi:hemolysin activation/secretion protein